MTTPCDILARAALTPRARGVRAQGTPVPRIGVLNGQHGQFGACRTSVSAAFRRRARMDGRMPERNVA